MFGPAFNSFFFFTVGIFTVLNGPLWLSVRIRVFADSRQAPFWLHQGVSWLSRLAGLIILATWAWISTGALKPTLLLCAAVAAGLFCLLDGPSHIITKVDSLKRGRELPAWMEDATFWFIRVVGAIVLLCVFITGILLAVT
jgi:hypothetical protein